MDPSGFDPGDPPFSYGDPETDSYNRLRNPAYAFNAGYSNSANAAWNNDLNQIGAGDYACKSPLGMQVLRNGASAVLPTLIGCLTDGLGNIAGEALDGLIDAIAEDAAEEGAVGEGAGANLGLLNCFVSGTLIATTNGTVPIEDITSGNTVWCCDTDHRLADEVICWKSDSSTSPASASSGQTDVQGSTDSIYGKASYRSPTSADLVRVIDDNMRTGRQAVLSTLQPGTRVCFQGRAYDLSAGKSTGMMLLTDTGIVLSGVGRTFKRTADTLVDLRIRSSGGRESVISGTPEHPFYVPAVNDYVGMGELAVGTVLQTANGGTVTVVACEKRNGSFQVYNFEVREQHNYYISDWAVLVHNQSKRVPTSKLRGAWEDANGESWPTDDAGNPQDATHIKALADGGTNDPSNISPQPHPDHVQQNLDIGDYRRWGGRRRQP
jgi:hypothetical protein